MWREAPLAVTASTCPTALTDAFAADLAWRPPCDQTVEMLSEIAIALTDCTGTRIEGTLDRDGTIHIVYPTIDDSGGGCTVGAHRLGGDPRRRSAQRWPPTPSPSSFSGTCPIEDCAIDAEATWTRL